MNTSECKELKRLTKSVNSLMRIVNNLETHVLESHKQNVEGSYKRAEESVSKKGRKSSSKKRETHRSGWWFCVTCKKMSDDCKVKDSKFRKTAVRIDAGSNAIKNAKTHKKNNPKHTVQKFTEALGKI